MIFTAGNLITLAVVLLVLVIFRQLDRGNRSLEKLRKYTDKLEEELSGFVEQRSTDIKDFAIELDVQQKAAKEILKRIQSVEDSLKTRADGIAQIDKRLAEYDKALDELMQMTGRAEENMKRLHDESEFIDSVGRRVKEAQSQFDTLIKQLPDVRKQFDADNQTRIATFRDGVVAALKSDLAGVAAEVDAARKKVDEDRAAMDSLEALRDRKSKESLEALDAAFHDAFRKAREEAEKLEDVAFVQLKESITERAMKLEAALSGKYESLQAQAKEKISEIQGSLKSVKAEWRDESAKMLDTTRAEIVDAATTLDERIDGLDTRVAEAERLYGTRFEAVEKKGETMASEFSIKVQERVAGFQEKVRDQLAAYQTEVKDKYASYQAEMKEKYASYRSEVEAMIAETKAAQKALGEETRTAADSIQGRMNEAESSVDARIAEIVSRFDTLQAEIGKKSSALIEASRGFDARLTDFVAEHEEKIRAASLEVQVKVLSDVEKQLDTYSGETDYKFKKLEEVNVDIGLLEDSLRAAMDNVQSKVVGDFQLFQNDQRAKQKEHEDRIATDLGRIHSAMDELEKELTNLKSQAYANVSEKLKIFEDDFFTDLQSRGESISRRLDEWQSGMDGRLDALAKSGEAKRAELETGYDAELKNRLEEMQKRTSAQAQKIETEAKETVASLKADFGKQRDDLIQATNEERTVLKKDVVEIGSRVAALREELDRRVTEAMDGFARQYQATLADTEKKTRGMTAEADTRIRDFKTLIQDMQEKLAASQSKLFGKLDDESKSLSGTLDDMDKRVKAFQSQTRLFERADEMKIALQQNIDELKTETGKIEARRQEMSELEAQFIKIKRLEEEINGRMTRFLAEKRRLDIMEEDFKKLVTFSQAMDGKLEQVRTSNDVITQMQARLRDLDGMETEVSTKFDRLEKKSSLLDSTADGLDKGFEQLGKIETALKGYDEKLRAFPDRIGELKKTIDSLSTNKGKAEETMEKLASLDGILKDVEKRIDEMQKARQWLARAETRFEELNRQAQEQVKLLGTLVKEETRTTKKERGAPPVGVRETVIKLAHQGWTVEEIARATKLSRGEVELILEIAPKA
jgi:chromosome segregation ATPase